MKTLKRILAALALVVCMGVVSVSHADTSPVFGSVEWPLSITAGDSFQITVIGIFPQTYFNNGEPFEFKYDFNSDDIWDVIHSPDTSNCSSFSFICEPQGYTDILDIYPAMYEAAYPFWTAGLHVVKLGLYAGDYFAQTEIDIQVTAAPIPEPEIYAMMGLGLGLLGWIGRRRRLAA